METFIKTQFCRPSFRSESFIYMSKQRCKFRRISLLAKAMRITKVSPGFKWIPWLFTYYTRNADPWRRNWYAKSMHIISMSRTQVCPRIFRVWLTAYATWNLFGYNIVKIILRLMMVLKMTCGAECFQIFWFVISPISILMMNVKAFSALTFLCPAAFARFFEIKNSGSNSQRLPANIFFSKFHRPSHTTMKAACQV